MKNKNGINKFKKKYEYLIFIFPWIIGVCVFFSYPLFMSLRLSFSKITTLFNYQLDWIGLGNFEKALFVDANFIPYVIQSIQRVAIFTPVIVILSMVIAVLLNSNIKFKGILRSIFFLPVLLGTGFVMNQLIGQGVDAKAFGAAEGIISSDGMLPLLMPAWIEMIHTFISSSTLILWKSGVQILLFLAGLQSIPSYIYESAKIDAATEWELFWKITMPMLSPITVLVVVYTVIESFTDISTPVINYILNASGNFMDMGFTAAMSWIYLSLVLLAIGIIFLFVRKKINQIFY